MLRVECEPEIGKGGRSDVPVLLSPAHSLETRLNNDSPLYSDKPTDSISSCKSKVYNYITVSDYM